MAKSKLTAALIVALLVMALASPAGADALDSDLQKKADAHSKKVDAAGKLDAAKAEDAQLEGAVRDLDASVNAQSSNAQSAEQAASAAQSAVGTAEARLAETEKHMTKLKSDAAAIAIRAYTHPSGNSFFDIVGSRDLAEASRRETLLSQVANADRSALGELRATREDQQAQQSNLAQLRDQAASRRQAAVKHLDELKQALTQQSRLKGALDTRIQEYTAEVDALSREESNIEALVKTRQAQAAAARASSGGGGGGGGSPSKAGLVWPVGGPVTSGFGMRWGRMHTGIDIAAGFGAPIVAAKSGTVISAGWNGGYGQATIIDHGGGLSTLYGHQSKISVSDGQSVNQGQVIGYEGCTGHCTGPHVHFETRVDGSPQNPMNFLK
ncbi:MAG TPA: peptidoglycan DD-metalloendopeptidase family protein [Acidimicrobiales bacterium]|nr:peptidoglycan DD-metalloendopeptidase family protein [Acidimicrobiales bacterium]